MSVNYKEIISKNVKKLIESKKITDIPNYMRRDSYEFDLEQIITYAKEHFKCPNFEGYETECEKYDLHFECCKSCWATYLRTDWDK